MNPNFNEILREAIDKQNRKDKQMIFTVIDNTGNSTVVEANDIVEAIESCLNSQTGIRDIVAVVLIGED